MKLTNVDGQITTQSPDQLKKGSTMKVSGNMVLRTEKPEQTKSYYKGIADKGVIPAGTKVVIESEPIAFKRPHTTQYWIKVRVEE